MIAYGMLYATAVGLPILLAAIVCATALRRYGKPERGVWLLALGLALTLPVAFLINPFGGASPQAPGTLAEVAASGTPPETGVLGLPAVVVLSVEQSGLGLDEFLGLAWLLASLFLMVRWAVAAHRLARVGASWRAGIVDGVHVWLTSDLGPAVAGVFRTRILVPSWLVSLPEERRSLVLLHEEEHVRARDPALMAVSRIARIMAPSNPLVWLLSSRLLHAVELDCDRRVLGRRPDIETYSDTLLTVSARDSRPLVAAAAFSESEVPLRKRIIAMTTPPHTVSVLSVLTVLALGVVFLIGSCEVPVPVALGPERQDEILTISVERDGAVYVNDEPYPMEDVSAVVALLRAESERAVVISIVGDREVPYRFMDQLEQELVAAGARRVVYEVLDSLALWSPPDDLRALKGRGWAVLLPEEGEWLEIIQKVGQRSLLHFTVRPNGLVDMRRGESTRVQRVPAGDIEGIWRQEVTEFPNLIAAVKTHPDAAYRFAMDVLDALHSANAERISLTILDN